MITNVRKFKAIGENIYKVAQNMLDNQVLCKLLKYTDNMPLEHSDLSEDQRVQLLHQNILFVPKVPENDNIKGSFVIFLYDSINPDENNGEFKTVDITILVLCPAENWVINAPSLRPFMIMSEIDKMLNGKKLGNIGKLTFQGADRFVMTNQLTGYSMSYGTYEFN